jgi:chromosome segregation ATPase
MLTMTAENQALLDAMRGIVTEAVSQAVAPLVERISALEQRMGALEQRMGALEQRMDILETRVETLDARTSQMMGDLIYLRDRVPMLEERIDNGFRALKSDLNLAFSDIRRISGAQERGDKSLDALRKELASLQQRIAALESAQ